VENDDQFHKKNKQYSYSETIQMNQLQQLDIWTYSLPPEDAVSEGRP